MPPRAAKRIVPAKKATPKPKQEEPLNGPTATPVEEKSIVEAETAVTKPPTAAPDGGNSNDETVTVKEEVSVTSTTTTTVVEESRVTEEIGGEKVSEVSCFNSVKVEESNVSEFVEEKRLEIGNSSNVGDVPRLEGNEEAVNGEEMEEDDSEEASEGEENEEAANGDNGDREEVEEDDDEEDGESGSEDYDPEEADDIQDNVEGEETAVVGSVGTQEVNANTGDNTGPDDEGDGTESDSDDEDDYMQLAPLENRKKQAGVEIFVGGLHRGAVEEDLIKAFGEFGEVKAVRIVKHPVSKKSRGYAFISYATAEQANKVLTELKDGIEVKGKRAGVSPSQDSDTLYMGNICKEWTKEKVLETLKGFGIEQIDEIYLTEDPKHEGNTRGFAFIEFSTHSDAMAAFQRLRKPDAVFGCDRSAKVAFAPSVHPNEEALSQVKTVFVEGLTKSWDEEKLKQLCEQYGPIEKIQLSRDLATVKRKDFGFVHFSSRENALACVEGINNAQSGEGDVKLKANIAKPKYKGLIGKTARGGFKVPKDGEKVVETEKSKAVKDGVKSNGSKRKGKPPRKSAKGGKQSRGSIGGHQGAIAASKVKEQPTKGRKRDVRNTNSEPSERPSKKPRGNTRGRLISGPGNSRKSSRSGRGRKGHHYDMPPTVYADPYVRGYAASGSRHLSRASTAASAMAPHAGYLTPVPTSHGRDPYDYSRRRAVEYDTRGSSAYVTSAYVGHGSRASSYVGGSMVPPPPPYAPAYSPYPPEYERGNAGGYSYPSSEPYLYRRPYY